jgi:hypothetical protein
MAIKTFLPIEALVNVVRAGILVGDVAVVEAIFEAVMPFLQKRKPTI